MIRYGPGQSIVDIGGVLQFQTSRSAGAAGPPAGAVVWDTFTGTDGTLLSAHTPDIRPTGKVWTFVSAAFNKGYLTSNKLSATTGNCRAWIDSLLANCTISTVYSNADASQITSGILYRYSATNNYSYAVLDGVSAYIIEIISGGTNIRSTTSFAVSPRVAYTLAVILSGSSVTFTVNGGTVGSWGSGAGSTNTKHGIFAANSGGLIAFDNFSVAP